MKLRVPLPPANMVPLVNTSYQSEVMPVLVVKLIFTIPVPILDPFTAVGAEGKVLTTAFPVEITFVVAPVEVAEIFPEAALTAVAVKRTYIVVVVTVPVV